MADVNYEFVGRFIYGAHRHGGDQADITNWMADALGVDRPNVGDDPAAFALITAFCSQDNSSGQLEEHHARFIETLKNRTHEQAADQRFR